METPHYRNVSPCMEMPQKRDSECTDQLLVSLRQVTGAQERQDSGDELREYTKTLTHF